jgi:hypothetical protein
MPKEDAPSTKKNPVAIPLERRVMPSHLAMNIVGVAPMTAPSPEIYEMRKKCEND